MEENGNFGKWTAGHLLSFLASLPIQDEGDVAISHFPDDTGNDKQR